MREALRGPDDPRLGIGNGPEHKSPGKRLPCGLGWVRALRRLPSEEDAHRARPPHVGEDVVLHKLAGFIGGFLKSVEDEQHGLGGAAQALAQTLGIAITEVGDTAPEIQRKCVQQVIDRTIALKVYETARLRTNRLSGVLMELRNELGLSMIGFTTDDCAPMAIGRAESAGKELELFFTVCHVWHKGRATGRPGKRRGQRRRCGCRNGAAEPSDDIIEMVIGMEAMITLQFERQVGDIGRFEIHYSDNLIVAASVVEPLPDIAPLAGCPQSSAGFLFAVKATEPWFVANDKNALSLDGLIAAPLWPAFGRASRVSDLVELIEHYIYPAVTHPLSEGTNAVALCIVELSVADKDLGQSRKTG